MPFAGLTSKRIMNAYPGLSSQDDPNNPSNQNALSKMLLATPTPQQPIETQQQAAAGNSQNAETKMPAPSPNDLSQNPNSDYMQLLKSSLAAQAIPQEQMAQIQGNVNEQQKGIGELKDYQKMLRGAPVQTDLSPLLALSDSLTGSKLAGSYSKPQTGQDRIGELAKIQNMSQEQRNKVTQDLVKLATGKSAQQQLRGISQLANLQYREQSGAQKQYDTQIGPVKLALEASSRFNDLLQAAQNGKLVPTSQLLNTLTEEQAKLATGKSNYGEGTTEGLRIKSYERDLKDLEQKIKNIPEGVLRPETAAQLSGENKILSEGYMNQADRTAKTLLSGATPTQSQVIGQRHNGFKGQFQDQFGYWGSKKQEGGQAAMPAPKGVDPKDWNAATPQQRQDLMSHLNGR